MLVPRGCVTECLSFDSRISVSDVTNWAVAQVSIDALRGKAPMTIDETERNLVSEDDGNRCTPDAYEVLKKSGHSVPVLERSLRFQV